jgi:hypothetical protein
MTMIGRRSTDHGTGGSEWIPMPPDSYMFEVGAGEVKLSSFKSDKGEDQYNVSFQLKLTDEEYERVKAELGDSIGEGEQLSGRTRYSCGLTLGWFKKGEYQSTRLADFLTTLLGSKQQKALREYFVSGGGPFISPGGSVADQISEWNTWFTWFEGCKVFGTITHRKDKTDPKKVWCDFGGPLAVGQRPGPADPDYEAFGRGKLRMILNQADAAYEEPEPEPATVASRLEESAPAAEMSADEKAALAAKYHELFGSEAAPVAVTA